MAVVVAADPWWAFVVRGIAAILFGILTFVWPGMALLTLVVLFGAYAIVDGVFNIAGAFRRTTLGPPRGLLVLAGIVSVLAGLVAFFMPGITTVALLYLIGAWAIVRGVLEIVEAIRLRKVIAGEWAFVVAGVLSVAFGVLVMVFPSAGALAVVLWIGAYAIVFGALLVGVGAKLRHRTRTRGPGPGYGELAHGVSR